MFGFLGKGDRGFTIILLGIVVALVFLSRDKGQYGWLGPGGTRDTEEAEEEPLGATVLYSRSLGIEGDSAKKDTTVVIPEQEKTEKPDAKSHRVLFSRKIGIDSDGREQLNVLYNRTIN
ncbi:MAG: hypothetical protein ACOYVD_02770 [Bacillota bacterium]